MTPIHLLYNNFVVKRQADYRSVLRVRGHPFALVEPRVLQVCCRRASQGARLMRRSASIYQIRPRQPNRPSISSNAPSLERTGQAISMAVAAIMRSKGSRCDQSMPPDSMAIVAV